MNVLGNGVYGLNEAARLTGLNRALVRRWFRGRGGKRPSVPVFQSDYSEIGEGASISFYDLIELNVGAQFREHGFSLHYVRRTHEKLQKAWNTKHPFCMRKLATDGKRIFAMELDEEEKAIVYDVETFQIWFDKIVVPVLDQIDYERATATAMAKQWRIANMVVLDPTRAFGKPTIEGAGVRTNVLAAAYHANDRDAAEVADWYGVSEDQLLAAVEFEDRISRKVA